MLIKIQVFSTPLHQFHPKIFFAWESCAHQVEQRLLSLHPSPWCSLKWKEQFWLYQFQLPVRKGGLGKSSCLGCSLCWSFNKSHFNVLLRFAFLGETQPELSWLHFPVPQVTVARWDLGGTPGQCRGQRSSFTNPLFSAQCIGLVLPTEPLWSTRGGWFARQTLSCWKTILVPGICYNFHNSLHGQGVAWALFNSAMVFIQSSLDEQWEPAWLCQEVMAEHLVNPFLWKNYREA